MQMIALLINVSCPTGEISHAILQEDPEEDELDTEWEPGEPPPHDYRQNQNDLVEAGHYNKRRYKCHSCEPPDCARLTVCENALSCWKSRVRESTGEESVSRGCTHNAEQLPMYCRTQQFTVQHKRHAVGQFHIVCCNEDLCNAGDFPELPDDGKILMD